MGKSSFFNAIAHIFLAFASLVISANSCHFGSETPFLYETQVFVYSDANANGIFDEGEEPIPNAVVTLEAFPPQEEADGVVWRTFITDDTGHVSLQGETFRYYEVGALTACGYHANQIARQSFVKNMPFYQVGFIPDQPQTGSSSVEIHFWIDRNGDGVQDLDETDMANTEVELWTTWDGIVRPDTEGGSIGFYFELMTDDQGRVRLELGNVCERFHLGRITVGGRVQKVDTTYVSSNVEKVDYSSNENEVFGYEFDSAVGKTWIEWGVRLSDF